MRILALADGHVASSAAGLEGLAAAQGLSPQGLRVHGPPRVSRRDSGVHVRGCIRHAAGDDYQIEPGKRYTLAVSDPRHRAVVAAGSRPQRFRQFASRISRCRPPAPQGEYRVRLSDKDKHHYQGTFQVQEYKLEPVQLNIVLRRRVYYRGEEIEGTIRATYDYGAPLAGREVTYQLADDRQHTATTDAHGEIPVRLSTREFSDSQVLPLKATLSEWNVQAAANLYLSAQGFCRQLEYGSLGVRGRRTVRGDADDEGCRGNSPLSQPLKLHVPGADDGRRQGGRAIGGRARPGHGRGRRAADVEAASRRPLPAARRGHRPPGKLGFESAGRLGFRRRGPGPSADPGRPPDLQGWRYGPGDTALARAAGAGPGHFPRRQCAGLSTGPLEAGCQPSTDPHDASIGTQFRVGCRGDERRPRGEKKTRGPRPNPSCDCTQRPARSPSNAT